MRAEDRLPPPGAAVVVQVFSLPKTGKWTITFLSEADGIITHWDRKKSVACAGIDQCPMALHRTRQVFKGYASAMVKRPAQNGTPVCWHPCVFELTERCWEVCSTVESLCCTRWTFERGCGSYGTQEVYGEQIEPFVGPQPFRFDFRPIVERLYRTRDIAWGQVPPFGERVVLLPVPVA